jgi:heme/copper-type cytochrome/quinol oxidase subunit 4
MFTVIFVHILISQQNWQCEMFLLGEVVAMVVIGSCWCLRLLQHYSPESIIVLEELIVSQLVTKVLYFMKLEGTLSCS